MNYKCPVCKKEWPTSLQVARHIFGTGDKPHREWVGSKGYSYIDLLLEQVSAPGNKSYEIMSKLVEEEQDKIK
ncbi:MAG TPA: hypothetical protein PLM71_02355 [Syntrophorhabdaceae bacterium]|nr:hypothetical protein [Syntrophorhabdaceae bacterium]HPU29146.1 hypothetical protein [Syntrophorhabdaceae bacterium]